jgi:membrane-bound metal-dependent hydrolase YbcI (DUF457 family)
MADFRTHVTTSSVLGLGYAGMGAVIGMPLDTSLVAGGLCGVSGMLPDLDSESGIPLREAMGFAAAVVPMLLVERFEMLGLGHDVMILIAAAMYFGIRFVGATLVSRFSVHRGMFHSLPAAFIFAGVAFLITEYAELNVRYFKAGGVFAGFMSHLLLDELYSIDMRPGRLRLKRSFGTAIKLWGNNGWANFSTYAKLAIVASMIAGEQPVMDWLYTRYPQIAERVQRYNEVKQGVKNRIGDSVGVDLGRQSPSPQTVSPDFDAPPAPNWSPQQGVPASPWSPMPAAPNDTPPSFSPPSGGGFAPNSGRSTAPSPWGQAMDQLPLRTR